MWQTINFNKLTVWLLPTFLRRNNHIAWLSAIIYPIVTLYDRTLYRMQHNGQVIYLEKVLNQWFLVEGYNPDQHKNTKTVHIANAYYARRKYLYQDYEQKPIYLGKTYIHKRAEYGAEYFDFTVLIPKSYNYNLVALKAQIDYYKLAGKKYKIEHY